MADQHLHSSAPAVAIGPAIEQCARPLNGPMADYFPNLVVVTHENRKALFYDDLLRGKTVMVNFISVKDEAELQMTRSLAKVQRFLGHRLGKDVFMYSITTDPEHDTPHVLADFAEKHGVGPGWLFLTGQPNVMQTLKSRFFASATGHDHGTGPIEDCSAGMVRYGNEAAGIWASCPAKSSPEWIAKRIAWLEPKEAPVGPPKRRGPAPLAAWMRQAEDGGHRS